MSNYDILNGLPLSVDSRMDNYSMFFSKLSAIFISKFLRSVCSYSDQTPFSKAFFADFTAKSISAALPRET